MSEAQIETTGSPHLPTAGTDRQIADSAERVSFLETFLNSFFQEKNIKWMLVVGAAIVFGSSLMLVTKQWSQWSIDQQFLSILGYTAAIFAAAEVSRKRLGLTSTYKVLHSLTLLLLPICFLALQQLTAGSATQAWDLVKFCSLLLPATAFLWFASSRILDHLLRGRQTTFLISYCLLCMAGALPVFFLPVAEASATAAEIAEVNAAARSVAVQAFAFLAICWAVFTAGVMKVNRHMFWLAEEHQLPRIFGFLPIAMLGLQFVVLAGTKAITAINAEWIGFGCVMVSATILMTTRTIADVFRQRTGNLVRPLPWNIVVPLFAGLVLAALGLTLSFNGFHYGGTTTYVVIPTALVAAVLMGMAARDTRHSGFVWAGMICAAIAYQCCPTLFADFVQSLKDSTAAAINQKRVPFSMYGITYLPLLASFSLASRWFAKRGEVEFSKPLKHFVTMVGLSLFCIAVTDWTSLLFVSLVNAVAFIAFAVIFQDRRYVFPALIGIVSATTAAIPTFNSIQGVDAQQATAALAWVPTLLAGLAALLTATPLPDRILNTIPISKGSLVRHRDPETNSLTQRSLLLQMADGSDRRLSQLVGCVLACMTAVHWIGHSVLQEFALNEAALWQYVFLMVAFVLYTLRNPRYLSGLCFWGMAGFAAVRWGVGQGFSAADISETASFVTAAASILGYLLLKWNGQISRSKSLTNLRRQLGFDTRNVSIVDSTEPATGGWMRQVQAFVVPLCDLSLATLSCLAVVFHLPLIVQAHWPLISSNSSAMVSPLFGLPTAVTVSWLVAAAFVFRSRTAGIAATIALPLWITATATASGLPLTAAWCPVIWATVEGAIFVVCSRWKNQESDQTLPESIAMISEAWLQVLLIFTCLSFAWPLRIVGLLCLAAFVFVDREQLNKSRIGYLAIIANVHLLLLAAGVGGCSGAIVTFLIRDSAAAIPFVFLTAAISVAVFDRAHKTLDPVLAQTWTALLRSGMVILAIMSLTGPVLSMGLIAIMTAGFVIAAATEAAQAVRRQWESYIWSACGVLGMMTLFLFAHDVITFGAGMSQFVLLGISITGLSLAHLSQQREDLAIIRRPIHMIGETLPTLVAIMAVFREFSGMLKSDSALNALALMISAAIYFQQAMVTRKRGYAMMAAIIMNTGLMLLWSSLKLTAPEFYLVPVGLSILAFVELLKKELPKASHDPLRYIGALTILVSPLFEIIDGNWAHIFTLMILSVIVILTAIGLRIRVLVYAGSAFLLADLVAMIVHTTMAHPALLWIGGVGLGVGVIALAAFCENHREKLLARIRFVSAELATWN